MNFATPVMLEPRPIEIDARPCELCGLAIDRHEMVDHGEGPEHYCLDLNELTLDELERRAEMVREIEVAAIFARLEAMDDPSKRLAPRSVSEAYRPARSTVDAFRYLVTAGDVDRLKAWLSDRPKDAPHLLSLLED
jgi:hypothetical protein